ncbi:MAG TPA: hypothetical protein VN515_05295 [Terriglobales bacterium]|nr:hypothetical protein [Terriglobales bacterium]
MVMLVVAGWAEVEDGGAEEPPHAAEYKTPPIPKAAHSHTPDVVFRMSHLRTSHTF